ncbi:hypothetical protein GCM10016455_05860 [Aliiroseovarius zhejiangensis]|uniref:Uncharacterized protein n=1 Tax=Aliiroseovarius zhejiangensis TaxID=1632025 RepID=A0ABQ3ISE1_9RHOB|nr:hypothetical protein [Aliiroseovarius zhejiangensis]GHE88559.1 hypothetical protein GCM10016455_05860 [Aliiroseovarius zhejiangensis]
MTPTITKLLASASGASAASLDMIESARDGEIRGFSNVGAGETLTQLADSLRLLLDAMEAGEVCMGEDETQLHGALIRFLEDRE